MKKLLLTFLIAFITALGANAAVESPYKHTFEKEQLTKNAGSNTLSGVSWSWTAMTYCGFQNNGVQIGSGSNVQKSDWTISTSEIPGTITSVKVTAYAGGSGTIKVSVGGKDFTYNNSINPNLPSSYGNGYDFTGSASGEIAITMKASSKAMYLQSIEVTFTTGGGSSETKELGAIMMGSTEISTDETNPTTTTVKGGGAISFTSENAASMIVYQDGVQNVSTGESPITWTAPEATDSEQTFSLQVVSQLQNDGEELQKKTAYLTVTVEKRPDPSDDFVLITDANDLSTEYTYILYGCNDSRGKQALMNSSVSSGYFAANQNQSTFNISDDFSSIQIDEANTETAIITLEESTNSGKYYLKIGNKYISVSGTDASLSTTKTEFTITFDTKNRAELKVGSNYLGYNASTPRFKPYNGNANRLGSIYLYAKKTMTPVEPGEVTSDPAADQGVITVAKGESITFTSNKAAKLKVEFIDQVSKNETIKGDTYTYIADAEDIISITPLDILDTEYEAKAGIFGIEFAAPEAVVATPAAENGTITVNKGTEIKFTSKNAAKLKVEFMEADAITIDGDTYTYKADAEDILTITPIGYNGNEATDKMAEFTVVFPAPSAVVANPAPDANGKITVNKGSNVTFSSENAEKLKVVIGDITETFNGSSYIYKADAEASIIVTPIGYNGKEASDKEDIFDVKFPTPKAIVVNPAPEGEGEIKTISIQKEQTITISSADADHLVYEIEDESGVKTQGETSGENANSWTYTADKDVKITVTPVAQNGLTFDGTNNTENFTTTFNVDVDLALGEITFSPAAGAVYANTEIEISCRNAESISYTVTVGETTSEPVSVTGNTAKVNIAEACTVNVTANGENETSKTASAAYTIKESAGITHTLSDDKTQVTFRCENADKLVVTTYEIDGSYTEETVAANTATADCNSMYAMFSVEAFQGEAPNEVSLGQDRFNLLSELNATITNQGEAWYRVNSISQLQANVDYIIVSHFPQANAKYEDIYMTNKYTNNGGQGKFDYGKLLNGELVDNDAYMTLDAASALTDAAIFRLISDGNGKWAFKITNVTGDATGEKILTYPTTNENSIRLIDANEATNKDYTTVYAGPGTADYPARMGAMRFDFEDSGSAYKYLRFNAGADGQGNPQGAMFRIYSKVAGIDHVRPLYLYGKLEQAPAEVPDYTAMVMYNGEAMTQEMGKLSVEGEEMDLMCHYNKLNGHNGGEISVKIIGFDGQAKILYPKERTAQSAYNKVKPNTASGSLTMAEEVHYDLAVDGATTTVPASLKDHYYEIEVQPFNWTNIAAFNVPTWIEDIDVENPEAVESEDGDARYFNLQGLEVKNPGQGLYIRVANGKATKILKK